MPGQPGPAVPQAQAKSLVRIDCRGANAKRDGDWVVPHRMEIRAVGGTVRLDFTHAVITQPTLRIEAKVRGGNLILVTRPGIEVDADDVAVHGGNVKVRPVPGPKPPVILRVEVSGEAKGGHIVARPRGAHSGSGCCAVPGRTAGQRPREAAGRPCGGVPDPLWPHFSHQPRCLCKPRTAVGRLRGRHSAPTTGGSHAAGNG